MAASEPIAPGPFQPVEKDGVWGVVDSRRPGLWTILPSKLNRKGKAGNLAHNLNCVDESKRFKWVPLPKAPGN